jgi:hypothetical protein
MVEERETCQPTKGHWKKGHEECENCQEEAREICKIFVEWHGKTDREEIVREAKEKEKDW